MPAWKNIAGIQRTNIYHVRNAPPGFSEWARNRGALAVESDEEWEKATAGH